MPAKCAEKCADDARSWGLAMTFDILQHLEQLKPDGGANVPQGDHSFRCPVCGAPNFKVNVATGKWFGYGCDCSSSEDGKRKIRDALSPAINAPERL